MQELEVEGGSGSSILFYCEKRDVTFCFTFTFFTFTILLSLFQFHCFTFKMVLLSLFLFVEKSPSHNPSNSNPELSQLLFFFTNQSGLDSFSSPQKSLSLPFMHRAKRFLPFSFFSSKIHLLSFSISNCLANR